MSKNPLCFVLMPFGQKPGMDGHLINFDAVYEDVIENAVRAAELAPLRADEEKSGGIIHKSMFERLVLCEYAIADLTTSNANVFTNSAFAMPSSQGRQFFYTRKGTGAYRSTLLYSVPCPTKLGLTGVRLIPRNHVMNLPNDSWQQSQGLILIARSTSCSMTIRMWLTRKQMFSETVLLMRRKSRKGFRVLGSTVAMTFLRSKKA